MCSVGEEPSRPFVEERLQQYKIMYLEKRKEEKKREEERMMPQRPRIDDVSAKIVSRMNVSESRTILPQ